MIEKQPFVAFSHQLLEPALAGHKNGDAAGHRLEDRTGKTGGGVRSAQDVRPLILLGQPAAADDTSPTNPFAKPARDQQPAAPGQRLAADYAQLEPGHVVGKQADSPGQQPQALAGVAPGCEDDSRQPLPFLFGFLRGLETVTVDTSADDGIIAGKITGDHAAGVVRCAYASVEARKEALHDRTHEQVAQKTLASRVEGRDGRTLGQSQGGEGKAGRIRLVDMQEIEPLVLQKVVELFGDL
ncbi:MAG: hypothetical protein M1455_00055 [Actinobacteria bacterium]|nr:hypothetical protein [Actinomycetota bacterium]